MTFNLNEMNEVVKCDRVFRCVPSDIVDTAFEFHSDSIVSGSHNILRKRNACFIRYKERNHRRRLNIRRRRLSEIVVKVYCIDPFVKKNSHRKRLWHGLERIEK